VFGEGEVNDHLNHVVGKEPQKKAEDESEPIVHAAEVY
jgi:hypothetical protein